MVKPGLHDTTDFDRFVLLCLVCYIANVAVLLITNSSTLLRFENPLKQSTFNSILVLGKIFRSIALMLYPVSVTTNCKTFSQYNT